MNYFLEMKDYNTIKALLVSHITKWERFAEGFKLEKSKIDEIRYNNRHDGAHELMGCTVAAWLKGNGEVKATLQALLDVSKSDNVDIEDTELIKAVEKIVSEEAQKRL